MNKEEKVVIFIDGSNFYHITKNLLKDKKPNNFNFEKFVLFLAGNRKIIKVHYYNVPLDRKENEDTYMRQQRFFDKIKRLPNFNFVLCRMQKKRINGKTIYEAKEDDIQLAVDMVELAYNDSYDTAILVSSDGDFVPAIKAVKRKGKAVENIGFSNKFSYYLKQECSKCIILRRDIMNKFFQSSSINKPHKAC